MHYSLRFFKCRVRTVARAFRALLHFDAQPPAVLSITNSVLLFSSAVPRSSSTVGSSIKLDSR